MIRRQFISNLALTLPAGLLLPDLLFAADKDNSTSFSKTVITIDAGKLTEAQLASVSKEGMEIIPLKSSSIRKISCVKNGFSIENMEGQVYKTSKIVTGSTLDLQPALSAVTLSVDGEQKMQFEYSGTKHVQRPVIITTPARQFDPKHLVKLQRKHKTAIMMVI